MKKYLLILILFGSSINSSLVADIAKTELSKSELCDFAIQALQELLKQSPEVTSKQAITKEQCMAISDEDINNAAKNMMAIDAKK